MGHYSCFLLFRSNYYVIVKIITFIIHLPCFSVKYYFKLVTFHYFPGFSISPEP
ncbi:hypothetical protein CLOSTHATH_00073 [Hungatella hathewayi DSM 13479]|uniref:Uncharacterized protein n=1 Tax=Hungatella hathewayi DSM 13479 TaxID=566550 RepID=D3A903_9FIRM|nr:hypothetical protein CLOSTHATH_00073 [Hungatella hathewayi DSM 13479]